MIFLTKPLVLFLGSITVSRHEVILHKTFDATYSSITGEYSDIANMKDSIFPVYFHYKTLQRGYKQYEMSNHLGNVLVVITDKRITLCANNVVSGYEADVISATDYSAFGAPLAGRTYSSPTYRYGFNGQMKDDEVAGVGNSLSATYWEYDARLGRRWNLDPKPVVSVSDYACFANNPILLVDFDGDEPELNNSDENESEIEKKSPPELKLIWKVIRLFVPRWWGSDGYALMGRELSCRRNFNSINKKEHVPNHHSLKIERLKSSSTSKREETIFIGGYNLGYKDGRLPLLSTRFPKTKSSDNRYKSVSISIYGVGNTDTDGDRVTIYNETGEIIFQATLTNVANDGLIKIAELTNVQLGAKSKIYVTVDNPNTEHRGAGAFAVKVVISGKGTKTKSKLKITSK